MRLVKIQIGIVPDCDLTLAIWRSGFDSYNILIRGFFDLPRLLFSKKSNKSAVGLAMYVASYTSGCPYCRSHTCSFARRGLNPETPLGEKTPEQEAVIEFANLAIELQKETISEAIDHWKGDQKQLDDIIMLGFAKRK